jgi:fumarylpyruvate hydrolase
MIWKIPEMISHLSKYYTLQAGDLIMTGTPAGVGPVQKGDYLEGSISKLSNLAVKVV